MPKKILLITSGQPALNPRLVKEADALADAGYRVTVLYAYWNAWGDNFDRQLLPAKKWKAICVGGHPQISKGLYFISRIIYNIARRANHKLLLDWAMARPAFFLKREAKKHLADLYIGHNLGALPAVVAAAKTHHKPCGFDAEDLHRYESSDDDTHTDVRLKTAIEDKYLPQVNYLSTSSPQIAAVYQQLYPALNPLVLLNVFEADKTIKPKQVPNGPLKLFWFSQTIGANRGLQDIVSALQLVDKTHFELHILGSRQHSHAGFIEQLAGSNVNLTFHDPVAPDKLTAFAAQFDVGLALEPGFVANNKLALSNKIFTYLQAGLAIIASDTPAQQQLLHKHPDMGYTYPIGNAQQLATVLNNYHADRNLLADHQNQALQLAQEQYNWHVESRKFLGMVAQILSGANQHHAA